MDRDDPILDALLSEVLGGNTPPDLTARILQAWAAQGQDATKLDPRLQQALQGAPIPPPLMAEPTWLEPIAPPVQLPVGPVYLNGNGTVPVEAELPTVALSARRETVVGRLARRRSSSWLGMTALAGGILACSIVGYLAYQGQWTTHEPIANGPAIKPEEKEISPPKVVQNGVPGNDLKSPPVVGPGSHPGSVLPAFKNDSPPKYVAVDPPSAWKDAVASTDDEIVSFVNQALAASWKTNKVKPSAPATDAEWCRRAYLRLVGRIPTVDELAAFTGSKSSDKRVALVDRLLFDKAYAEEFNNFWATQWSNTLIGRSGMQEKDGLVSAEGLQQYLRESVQANKPYNKVVYELIAATGSNKPGTPDFNGATNFLLASQNDKSTLATARTTRVFLGQQLQCAQCHDHPFNKSTQHEFWALNSFFRQMKVERDASMGFAKLRNSDFHGETGQVDEADVFYERRNGQMKVAYPQFAGIELPKTGAVSEIDRRQELARMIAASDDVSRAAVNRFWSHFLGYGFTRPVDDMGEHNPVSQPELLERLAKEFKAHNYDTKSLLRWIALSEPFGLSSKIEAFNVADAPQMGTAPLFSHYYTRQMQAEELYESLVAASQIAKSGGTPEEQYKARLAWLGQFTQSLKTDEGDEASTFNGTIPQSLMMMNGELTKQAISSEHSALLKRVAETGMKPQEKVEHLFLAAVARKPQKRELDIANQLIATHNGNVNAALPDIWWALLNSNEFILDH